MSAPAPTPAAPLSSTLPLPPVAVYEVRTWHPSASSKAQDRTLSGLLAMVIGFGLAWIPYVGSIGSLFVLIGLFLVGLGRWGFGRAHRDKVLVGGFLILVALIGSVILAIWFVFALLGDVSSSSASVAAIGSQLQSDLSTFFVAGAILTVFTCLGQVVLVYELSDQQTRYLLWTALFAAIAIQVLVAMILLPQIDTVIAQATSGTTFDPTPIQNLESTSSAWQALAVVPDLLFSYGYYRARERAKELSPRPAVLPPPPGTPIEFRAFPSPPPPP